MPTRAEKTHYEVLGVPPASAWPDIRAAYIVLAQRHHPDSGTEPSHERFSEITLAYRSIKEPADRRAYDAQLAMLVAQCLVCDGTGTKVKRGLRAKTVTLCSACKGTGRV